MTYYAHVPAPAAVDAGTHGLVAPAAGTAT
jgi:hypothetical protein